MNTNVESLTESDTIQKAAQVMAETGVGFLPICDNRRRVVGVVTDRDLAVRALAKKLAAETTSATLIMTSPAVTCAALADVREAELLMGEERKCRLVVTDDDGRLAGVLSLVDIIEKVPDKRALAAARTVLSRDALGPRGGAARGEPLLQNDPDARALPPSSDDIKVRDSVFTGAHRERDDLKEFPNG
jgi:signal-transduction protein with cAMP-binding, CBS, and nucleotidyltransferase domain